MFSFSITPNSAAFILLAIIISVIDLRSYRIPDPLLAAGAFVSIVLCCSFDRSNVLYRFLLSGAAFLLLYLFSVLVKTGLGFGDVKFISLAAFNLGLFDTWIMLTLGCLLGICAGIVLKFAKKAENQKSRRIPFAPFLCLGALASLFANPPRL